MKHLSICIFSAVTLLTILSLIFADEDSSGDTKVLLFQYKRNESQVDSEKKESPVFRRKLLNAIPEDKSVDVQNYDDDYFCKSRSKLKQRGDEVIDYDCKSNDSNSENSFQGSKNNTLENLRKFRKDHCKPKKLQQKRAIRSNRRRRHTEAPGDCNNKTESSESDDQDTGNYDPNDDDVDQDTDYGDVGQDDSYNYKDDQDNFDNNDISKENDNNKKDKTTKGTDKSIDDDDDDYGNDEGGNNDDYANNEGGDNDDYGNDEGGSNDDYGNDEEGKIEGYRNGKGENNDDYVNDEGKNNNDYGNDEGGKLDDYGNDKGRNNYDYGNDEGGNNDDYGNDEGKNNNEYGNDEGGNNDDYGNDKRGNNDNYVNDEGGTTDDYGNNEGGTTDDYGNNEGGNNDDYYNSFGGKAEDEEEEYYNYLKGGFTDDDNIGTTEGSDIGTDHNRFNRKRIPDDTLNPTVGTEIPGGLGKYFVYVNCTTCKIKSQLVVLTKKASTLPTADNTEY